MDHHCCFSDRCIGYRSMKPFVIFTGSVCLLTVVGMTTIWFNLVYRHAEDAMKSELGGGLTGYGDFVQAMVFLKPELGFTYWTYYDMVLIQASAGHGCFALWMFVSFILNVRKNEGTIDALKKGSLRHFGKGHLVRDRPPRSLY